LHVGTELDSAIILVNFGTDIYYPGAAGFLDIAGGSEEFTEFEVPIEVFDTEMITDTVILVLIANSDSTYLAGGNESYYVFDELQFVYEEPPLSVYEDEIANHLTISPNPTKDLINISLPGFKFNQVKIYDEVGKTVVTQNGIFNSIESLNISHLNKGLYIVKITGDDFTVNKKLIKL